MNARPFRLPLVFSRCRSGRVVAGIALAGFVACAVACTGEGESKPGAEPGVARPEGAEANAEATPDAGPRLPDAADLLAAHVEAAGGADKIPKHVEVKSTLSVVEQRLSETSTLWWDEGRFYVEAHMDGVGETRAGFDGDVAWSDDPIYRLRELSGRERAQQIRMADLFLVAHWRDYFRSAETVEEATRDGKRYYEVKLIAEPGDEIHLSLDAKSKLLARLRFDLVTPAGPMKLDTVVSDYRPVNGYLVPHKQVSSAPLLTMEQTYTEVRVGQRTDAKRFAPPGDLTVVAADPRAESTQGSKSASGAAGSKTPPPPPVARPSE